MRTIALAVGFFMMLPATVVRAIPILSWGRPFPDYENENSGAVSLVWNYSVFWGDQGWSSVDYQVVGPAGRFVPQSGHLTFPSNGPNFIRVGLIDDDIPGEDFSISMRFSNPVNLSINSQTPFTLFIRDNDRRSITVSGGSILEGDAGAKLLPFTITQSGPPLSVPFSFTYTASGGTAAAGEDYAAITGNATIPAGASSTTVYVSVTGDTQIELDETIGLSLSNLSLPVESVTPTPGTIQSDDFPPGPVPSATLVTEAPGTDTALAWFAVDLPAPRTVDFSCRVSTRDGTALAGSDYNALAPATVTFAPGETQKWVAITVKASASPEAREQFFLDVEALDSHEVNSAPCTIERLTITEFWRPSAGIFALRFPAGLGQRYVVEEAATPNAGWTPVSSLLSGTGFPVTQFVFADSAHRFFRVRTTLPLAPGTPAVGS